MPCEGELSLVEDIKVGALNEFPTQKKGSKGGLFFPTKEKLVSNFK